MNVLTKVDDRLSSVYGAEGVGAVGIITLGGKTVFRKAYGVADLELGVPMEPDMVFGIGSITKVFTAAVVMMLAEEHLLSYSDSVLAHLPECPQHWAGVTLDNLLAHTSGITDLFRVPGYIAQMSVDVTPKALVAMVKDLPLQFEPGTAVAYSNPNYVLLGLIVEAITGKSLQQVTEERVIRPLGHNNTFHTVRNDALVPRRAKGYTISADGTPRGTPYVSWSQAYAAGTIHSNADDLTRFVAALLAGDLLSPESVAHLTTPPIVGSALSSCGYGTLFRLVEGQPPFVRVSGSSNGYEAYSLYLLEQQAYVAILANASAHSASNPFHPLPLVNEIALWLAQGQF